MTQPIPTDGGSSVVRVSACLLVTTVNPAKMDEPIEKPSQGVASWGQWNHVLYGGKVPKLEGALLTLRKT